MRRVKVEITGRDDDVLRVWCLKYEQAARPEHSDASATSFRSSQSSRVDYVKCEIKLRLASARPKGRRYRRQV